MSERIHALAQQVFGKSSVEDCTLEELQQFTKRFPYFAPAQFLLLQKLSADGSPDAEKQQQKAVLYYHDPLQFTHFISSDKFYNDALVTTEQKVADTEKAASENIDNLPPVSHPVEEENSALQRDEVEFINQADMSPNPETISNSFAADDTIEPVNRVFIPSISSTNTEGSTTDNAITNQPLLLSEESTQSEIKIDEPVEEAVSPEEMPETEEKEFLSEELPQQAVIIEEPENSSQQVNISTPEEKETEVSAPAVQKPADETAPLAFEPYHTVDYFASQGIKITAEELPKDKLSKQLRSFTEWLKMMKRLPVTEGTSTPQSTAEKTVENMASHSVEKSEVVTEAMAEVWAKQGAKDKAIETYNKLSLLNPSKNAYFAAKIENLKGS